MKNFERIEFEALPAELSVRQKAEEETRRDLQKPIEQLLCDVHEEIMDQTRTTDQNLVHAYRRMVSVMVRVAASNERTSRVLLGLTWALTILTVVLVILTIVMLVKM
jgi:hypothetical protein